MARNATKADLDRQAEQIMSLAEDSGVESNFFFVTTFERYLTQLNILDELKASMERDGMQVTKEYVKGRKNLYSNPAISDYNRTTDSANKTVGTLMRIIRDFGVNDKDDGKDPLMEVINGGSDEE